MSSIASDAETGVSAARHSPRTTSERLIRYLPVLVFFLYALTTPGLLRGEQAGVYATAAALVEHGSFAIDGAVNALAPDEVFADDAAAAQPYVAYAAGHFYLARPPGLALLASPLYLLGTLLGPLLGAQATIIICTLLGPLLIAHVVHRVIRLTAHYGLLGIILPLFAAIYGLPLNYTQPLAFVVIMIAVLLASWVAPLTVALLRGPRRPAIAVTFGLLIATPLLLDYGVGIMAGALLAIFLAGYIWRQRDLVGVALILIGAAVPLGLLMLWHTFLFGVPWQAAFRASVDPAHRLLWSLFGEELHLTIVFPVLIVGTIAVQRGEPIRWRRDPGAAATLAVGIAITSLALTLFVFNSLRLTVIAPLVPIDWLAGPIPVLIVVIGALLALLCVIERAPWSRRGWRGTLPAALIAALFLAPLAGQGATDAATPNYAAPFTTAANAPVWTVERGTMTTGALRLEANGHATSPWIEARPGLVYAFAAAGDGPLTVTFLWEDLTRASLGSQTIPFAAGTAREASFAAPVRAAGLRLRLDAPGGAATVTDTKLALVGGVRVEPFPDGNRAALAFSFDWESAMGGLIHSRSVGSESEGAAVGLRPDGGPSVAEAEAKGLRMREGARFLADLFARHDIHATFYSTGYNLLDDNALCRKYLGDPVYRNANQANGWSSDWWRTNPWYGDDPCSTEALAPAWYFASETRFLAGAGHEIASHSFGHLYVRGVTPAQLRDDLEEWNRAAVALGLPPTRSFAFPWTSSNSLDGGFWAVFEQVGMTILTRIYPSDLRYPYELARIKGNPNLIVFPDFYLASNATARDTALTRIDVTIASRGYHSIWNHPNEALEQGGQAIWQQVVEYAAAQRQQGLWIAPVSTIADYGRNARHVTVTALPVAGGDYLIVENFSGQRLSGVTLGLPAAGVAEIEGRALNDVPTTTIILPPLEPGARLVVLVRR